MNTITERIARLREAMKRQGITACIIPSTDPHASEYIADCWMERAWISGFTGSAGDVVVTDSEAWLWTDSRYFLQAGIQLADTGIGLMKDGVPGTPSIEQWLCANLRQGQAVAINPEMISVNAYAALLKSLSTAGVGLKSIDLISPLWTDRPQMPLAPFFVLDGQYAGRAAADKLKAVREVMSSHKATAHVISALDEICWLLNIRGTDVDFNPVVVSYALIEAGRCTLFTEDAKVTAETRAYLESNGVRIAPYAHIIQALGQLPANSCVMLDPAKINEALFEALPPTSEKVLMQSPIFGMKAVKNPTELAGIRQAMKTDGVSLVRFFMWLEQEVKRGQLTEYEAGVKLREFRSQGRNFVGESFGTIAGYGPNGAIVHYEAEPDTAATLKPTGMFLLDSGGQYLDGTTDITRTICFDEPTAEMRRDYTLVLKGHIDLALAQFPEGTRGNQLDILARQYLWNEGLSYGHGTGHGVGHFLCVHEGPHSIRTDNNPTPLRTGMVMSDEPGLYRTGLWGIRIENLVSVEERMSNEFARFYGFEVLTLFPYYQPLIDWSMLTERQTGYVNAYHQRVYDTLAPELTAEERRWLADACRRH